MKIISLQAENIKKLRAVRIDPEDNLVMITGPNAAGKSSVLDLITMGLCGGKAIPSEPIKRGAEKGNLLIDLGDYVIKRSFTANNNYIEIKPKDGGKALSSPQKFLDEIVGSISFDPLDFINNHPAKEQRKILLELIGINVDELDAKEKELRKSREDIGRDLTRVKSEYQNLTYFPAITETEEISLNDLTTQLNDALSVNALWDERNGKNEQIRASAKQKEELIEQLKQEIEEAKVEFKTNKQWLLDHPKREAGELSAKVSYTTSYNLQIRQNLKKREKGTIVEETQKSYNEFTKQIEDIEIKRKEALTSTPLPVEGLSFSPDGILYNSIPLDQASDGEKLMVSLAISMALNPTLKVLRIKDGSLLDQHNRDIIYSQIKEKDYQLWFESVASEGGVGIYIEDGEIVSVNGKKTKNKP